jgi:CBS domain-containing protein
MNRTKSELTSRQRKDNEAFLHLFSDVEGHLKNRLGLRSDDRTFVSVLVEKYEEVNPFWTDSANQMRHLAEIRNLLTHQRGLDDGYPIAVAPRSLEALRQIEVHLRKPEPVCVRHRKGVTTVAPDDPLTTILTLAVENGFSQFPVVSEGVFKGLVTENEIIRWLGGRVRSQRNQVNLAEVTVRSVLKEKDPFLRGIAIFHFEGLDAPVQEVMGRFSVEPALEAILLTASGTKHTPLEGIITQWDAARYSR